MKQRVYITRKLPEEVVAPLRQQFEIRMWESAEIVVPRTTLLEEVKQAEALWTTVTDVVDTEVLENATRLKIIANFAVGYNNIDVEEATKRNIIVTNTPGVLNETTADLTFALLLSTARRLSFAEAELRDGKWTAWSPMGYTGMDVSGATIGIIGMGRIGEAVARRALGFNMKVLYYNRHRKEEAEARYGFTYMPLHTLLQQSDFVVVMAPYTPETVGLIGKKELSLMKPSAILINTARGGIVDEAALYDALTDGTIWAAGLDVFETEPVPVNHPLLTLPNVTALPHIGSASIQTRMAMMRLNADDIQAVLLGHPPQHPVNELT